MPDPQGSTYRSQFGVQTTGATSLALRHSSLDIQGHMFTSNIAPNQDTVDRERLLTFHSSGAVLVICPGALPFGPFVAAGEARPA